MAEHEPQEVAHAMCDADADFTHTRRCERPCKHGDNCAYLRQARAALAAMPSGTEVAQDKACVELCSLCPAHREAVREARARAIEEAKHWHDEFNHRLQPFAGMTAMAIEQGDLTLARKRHAAMSAEWDKIELEFADRIRRLARGEGQ